MKRATIPLFTALAGLLLSGCVVSESLVSDQKRAYAYSWQEEVELGQEVDAELADAFGLYDDEALTAYVTRVGEALLAHSHLRRADTPEAFRTTPFTFRVLDTPIINAFALPGGYIYVTRGLLAHLENEAQLAVVLGHEIAHVAARHTSQDMLEAQFAVAGLVGAALLAEELFEAGDVVLGLGGIGLQLFLLKHGRKHEQESDKLGVEYAVRAGYQAAEGADFFSLLERFEEAEGGGLPTFLSSHPDPGRREEQVRERAADWEAQGFASVRVEEEAFAGVIDGIVLGQNPRHGFVEDGVFYHPDERLQFSLPEGWEAVPERMQVTMGHEDEEGLLIFRIDHAHTSAQEAAEALVEAYELEVVRERSDRVGGLPAYRVVSDMEEEGDSARLVLSFIEYDGHVFYFAGIAPLDAYDDYAQTFDRAIRSFRPLKDRDILAVEPVRLHLTTASREAPFRSFLSDTRPADFTEDHMALLNHVGLDDLIPRGTRLKLAR